MIDYSKLKEFSDNIEQEVKAFVDSFSMQVSQHGKDSYSSMISYFNDNDACSFAIVAKPSENKDQMYRHLCQMLFVYPALNSKFFIFASDVRAAIYDTQKPESKNADSMEALMLVFVSSDASASLKIPYTIVEDFSNASKESVQWSFDQAEITSLTKHDPTEVYQGDIVELLYVMSQIKSSPFTFPQLLNFYSHWGFEYKINDKAILDKIEMKVNYND